MDDTKLLIGGEWVSPPSAATFVTTDPADGTELAVCIEAGGAEVDAAVAAARTALADPRWRDLPASARARLLWRLADLLEEHRDELAETESRDNGMPVADARAFGVPAAAEHLRYYAGWCTKIEGAVAPVSFPDTLHYTRREPVGVCALIVPWNGPLLQACWKLAPALACGNTVILKPAEQTPLSALRLGELVRAAGLPDGVVNILTGGPSTGRLLVEHPGVDKVSFTGSTEVGRQIVRASAGNLKRLTLELGGKAPSIITDDVDIDAAVQGNVAGAMFNSGQVCAAFARLYVHRRRVEEFTEKFAAAAAGMTLGRGMDAGTRLGPLISEAHLTRVDGYVRTAVDEGGEVITGGRRAGGALAAGSFYEPTVVTGVTDEMTIAREEVFGPVVPIMPFDDYDEVVERANALEYGLAASIWTQDLATAHRLAARVRAGAIFINMLHVPDVAAPWGGFKASGWGREMGRYALDAYTEVKGVWTHLIDRTHVPGRENS
ncbi:aldehyde dehydrogenase family protein [Actinomadura macra]|uniref:aldehyde dehydrogenase family protein n=1 Tax=Actinomadura macra TaxID=46164 RepID=UPI00082A89A5|nr:aldehyde dehydrogenase family protein [Actinomadura macra]